MNKKNITKLPNSDKEEYDEDNNFTVDELFEKYFIGEPFSILEAQIVGQRLIFVTLVQK